MQLNFRRSLRILDSQYGFANTLVLGLLLLGLTVGVYLTQHKQLINTKASSNVLAFDDTNGNPLPLNSSSVPYTTSSSVDVVVTSTFGLSSSNNNLPPERQHHPTPTPTKRPTRTPTPSPLPTLTLTPTPTNTPTLTNTPTPTFVPTATTIPSPTPIPTTVSFQLAESQSDLATAQVIPYTSTPTLTPYTFLDPSPGAKFLFIRLTQSDSTYQDSGPYEVDVVALPTLTPTPTPTPSPVTLSGTIGSTNISSPISGASVSYFTNSDCTGTVSKQTSTNSSGQYSFPSYYGQQFCISASPPSSTLYFGPSVTHGGIGPILQWNITTQACQIAGGLFTPDSCGYSSPSGDVAWDNAYNFVYFPPDTQNLSAYMMFGSFIGTAGSTVPLSVQANDPENMINKIEVWWGTSASNVSLVNSCTTSGSGILSCTLNGTVPSVTTDTTYYIYTQVYATDGRQCSGNNFGIPAGYTNCGTVSHLTLGFGPSYITQLYEQGWPKPNPTPTPSPAGQQTTPKLKFR